MSSTNTKLIMSVVGGLTLAGLAYYVFRSSQTEEDHTCVPQNTEEERQAFKSIIEEIDKLGEPKKNPSDGQLEFKYIVKFSETVARLSKRRIMSKMDTIKEQRRQALKNEDHDKYKEVVGDILKLGDQVQDQTLHYAAEHIGYTA